MVTNWLDPVLTGLRYRKDIAASLQALSEKVFGRRLRLAITGMEGVGKTVLLHALTGESLHLGYEKPTRSQKIETRKVKTRGAKLLLSTVPGQQAHPRYVALNELFRGRKPVDGVIHVVGFGFATVRIPDAVRTLIGDKGITTLNKFRAYQKKRELGDLRETCQAIRDSHRTHHAPQWLVTAVDKIDLYYDEIEEAEHLYSPSSKSSFAREINELHKQIGTDYFRCTALPICGCLEDFSWNGQIQASQLNNELRQRYLVQFLTELGAY